MFTGTPYRRLFFNLTHLIPKMEFIFLQTSLVTCTCSSNLKVNKYSIAWTRKESCFKTIMFKLYFMI